MKTSKLALATVAIAITTVSCASQKPFVAKYSNMSEAQFTVEAIAPREAVRHYAICKAVWFAEKKNAPRMSLGNPAYDKPSPQPGYRGPIPDDWISLKATAYLFDPNPSGNPFFQIAFQIAEKAEQCRQMWDWYQ